MKHDLVFAMSPFRLLLCTFFLFFSTCSVTSGRQDSPDRGQDFYIDANPGASCENPDFAPNCGVSFSGVLTERTTFVTGVNNSEFIRLIFEDSLQIFDLGWVSHVTVPVKIGSEYDVSAELVQTTLLGYGSFEIRDEEGLVFFATTEVEHDWSLNPDPPDGWSISMNDGEYDNNILACNLIGMPQVVAIQNEGQSISLAQGDNGQIGDFVVNILVAEEVDYSDTDCLDFIAPELSYTIARVE